MMNRGAHRKRTAWGRQAHGVSVRYNLAEQRVMYQDESKSGEAQHRSTLRCPNGTAYALVYEAEVLGVSRGAFCQDGSVSKIVETVVAAAAVSFQRRSAQNALPVHDSATNTSERMRHSPSRFRHCAR